MERLTFEGNFCDIAMCKEERYGSFCEDGTCSQRKVWERLKHYEDLQEQGRLVELPCLKGEKLFANGKEYKASHWNITLTAVRDEPGNRSGRAITLLSIEEAEAAAKGAD